MKFLICMVLTGSLLMLSSIDVTAQSSDPNMSKIELKQMKAQKKLEKKIRKEKLKAAKAKAKEYAALKEGEQAAGTNVTTVKKKSPEKIKQPTVAKSKTPKSVDKGSQAKPPKVKGSPNTNTKVAQQPGVKPQKVKTPKVKQPKPQQSQFSQTAGTAKKKSPNDSSNKTVTSTQKTKKPKELKTQPKAAKPKTSVADFSGSQGDSKKQPANFSVSENELSESDQISYVRTQPTAVLTSETTERRARKKPDCNFTYNTRDAMTGQTKKALEPRYFFGYTEDELKEFMQGEDFLVCTGFLSEVTGVKTLNLTFTMDSPYARDEYGSIQAGSQVIIRTLSGETINLLSEKYDSGSVSNRTGKTTYKSLYIISARDEKVLSRSEIDMVRVVWGAGYEDYEVYELDFIKDQLECLNNSR